MDDDISEYISINDLTKKLKDEVKTVYSKNDELKRESDSLKKENLEKFLLEKTGELVVEGLDTIKELKSIFVSNPNAEEIDSLAQAFKAVSSALSVLKDIQVTNSKIENNKELKEMDIKAKKEMLEGREKGKETERILLTREEVMKQLIDRSEVLEAEFEKVETVD
jgi:hypothetical protein